MASLKVPYFTVEQLTNNPKEFVDKLNQFCSAVVGGTAPQTPQYAEQVILINTGDETTKFPWRGSNGAPRSVTISEFRSTDGGTVTSVGSPPDWHYSNGTVFIDRIRGDFDLGFRYYIKFKAEV